MINKLSIVGKGLENALNLRNQFGLTPPMGSSVAKYYDEQYYQTVAGR